MSLQRESTHRPYLLKRILCHLPLIFTRYIVLYYRSAPDIFTMGHALLIMMGKIRACTVPPPMTLHITNIIEQIINSRKLHILTSRAGLLGAAFDDAGQCFAISNGQTII